MKAKTGRDGSSSFPVDKTIFNLNPHWFLWEHYEDIHTKQRSPKEISFHTSSVKEFSFQKAIDFALETSFQFWPFYMKSIPFSISQIIQIFPNVEEIDSIYHDFLLNRRRMDFFLILSNFHYRILFSQIK